MQDLNFHKDFIFNGHHFGAKNELLEYARELDSNIHTFLTDWFDKSTFVKVRTSGSTGEPKQIQLKKEYMVNSALATGAYFELPEKTTALLCLSTNYIAGKMMLVRALVLGWHLDIVEAGSYPLHGLQKTYEFSAMVPLQVHNSLEDLHRIKTLIVGGGVVSQELQKRMRTIPTAIYATYGMTETITHIAVKKLNQSLKSNKNLPSFYTILPNIKISKDIRECLVIDAPKITEESVVTNDVVRLISETEFEWLGRYDTIINSGGIKLIPEQIELKLSEIIHDRFFVHALPDESLGEKLILIIESQSIAKDIISNRVRNLISLNKFERPKEIYFVDQFIETETKKTNRLKTMEKLFKL